LSGHATGAVSHERPTSTVPSATRWPPGRFPPLPELDVAGRAPG
jgi:hypothetical protein